MSEHPSDCVFCGVDESRIAWNSPLVLAVWDGFPVSPGHALIVPRRHVASWDALTRDEKAAILAGVDAVRAVIAADLLLRSIGCEPFSWGRASLTGSGETRDRYMAALRAADKHDYGPLLEFVRS